jgi:hypothetical protein
MGLDNIPKEYACKKIGSAVLDEEGRIDCNKTQEQNLCPWKSQLEISGVPQRVVLGMFGTDCWYRGKHAQALIHEYDDAPYSFYGKELSMDDSGNVEEGLEPEDCLIFADWMDELADVKHEESVGWQEALDLELESNKEVIEDIRYIAWWLRFVANNCDGFTVWY